MDPPNRQDPESATQNFTLTVMPLSVTTASLPNGSVRSKSDKIVYLASRAATAGHPPYKWSLTPGSNPLPPGLKLKKSWGVITGTATTPGPYSFAV